mmetsp:Transcript_10813/g.22279  ORF Transcript_10813/g.22279 Transcript_10813/m.22279 type:complete len:592 (+) Transcript_10813:717-2492(+)|eukprot:CAMPEP_0171333274 /NCGR_PEP_ID=MMETSP0878-20121228/3923_1 /TAXON_ID=67004 /ORGANISM="Thalassiosira weissflogii, Strain CCMP1336" /LENGTH=591 /DNA_ID=CAMNT_0011834205 /DNA_START=687 /DNA_END=2462 /DNA_ORIENTATION=-
MSPPMSTPNSYDSGDVATVTATANNNTATPNNVTANDANGATKTPPKSSTTPVRATNNYSNTNTPIASAKRPRGRRISGGPNSHIRDDNTVLTPMRAPMRGVDEEATLSPMHSVKPVPRNSHIVHGNSNDNAAMKELLSIPDEFGESESPAKDRGVDSTPVVRKSSDSGDSPSNNSASSSSWVGRKVDAIFSPVLSFLHGATGGHAASSSESKKGLASREENANHGTDDDDDKDIQPSYSEASESKAAEVSNVVQEVLREAAKAIEKDEATATVNGTDPSSGAPSPTSNEQILQRNASEETYDDIPGMSITESSGDGIVDADGDVAMVDCYLEKHDSKTDNSYDSSEVVVDTPHSQQHQQQEEDEYDDEEEEFNPYLFIKSLPPYAYAIPPGWEYRPKRLPPIDPNAEPPVPPICLVLDLDETLVHCTVEPIHNADMVFPVEFNGIEYQVHVRCRPYLRHFLESVHDKFEVVVFTASQQVYADKLLDKIDPEGKFIRHRMFRDSCLPVEGNFLKDLNVLGRDLSKAVLVDNSPHAFGYQVDNGIPIESWFDDPRDTELLKLEKFLRTLHDAEDVRDVVRAHFRTHRLVQNA